MALKKGMTTILIVSLIVLLLLDTGTRWKKSGFNSCFSFEKFQILEKIIYVSLHNQRRLQSTKNCLNNR